MKKHKVTRSYHLSDAELITTSKAKISFMRRDALAFNAFGITSQMVTELENKVVLFYDMPTDIEVKCDKVLLTQLRISKAEELRVALRNLMMRVQMTFGASTSRYKSFGTDRLSKKVRGNLLLAGRTAVQKGRDFLPKLAVNGVSAKMLTGISALCDELENLILEQDIKIGDRSVFQENRIVMGNAIYSKMMSYTAVGLIIWETSSPARYNDYVIYGSKGKKADVKKNASTERELLIEGEKLSENAQTAIEIKSDKFDTEIGTMIFEMTPRIETLEEKKLVGKRLPMSLANNKTSELWKSFMPRHQEIANNITNDLISMQVYKPNYFANFNPTNEFEKWATVEVSDFDNIPNEMEMFTLPGGLYAVFEYKGLSTDYSIFQYIFGTWLPKSDYVLDDRPHFEILGEKYKNNDPESEEEIWIPVKLGFDRLNQR